MRRVKPALAIFLTMMLSSCHNSNPIRPSIAAPIIECPATQSAESRDGKAAIVSDPPPTVTEGTTPITMLCVPASGTAFAIGSTSVTCTTLDSIRRTASCSFPINVTKAVQPDITATSFVAFGDSITAGTLATDCGVANCAVSTVIGERRLTLATLSRP